MESEIEADPSWDDQEKEDMALMTTETAEDRKHWHVMIQAGTLRSLEADRWEGSIHSDGALLFILQLHHKIVIVKKIKNKLSFTLMYKYTCCLYITK